MSIAPVKVLLVEDSPSDADLLLEILRQTAGGRFQITWVERLDDALARLREASFDVLLLDLSLPDSSGPDTFRRAHLGGPGVPIVLLTSVENESIGLEAVREGVQDYLVKGQTDGRQIARAIRYAIERQQFEAEIQRRMEQLRVANEDLARFNRLMVDRELRMVELKKQVNALCDQLGQPPRYPLDFEKATTT